MGLDEKNVAKQGDSVLCGEEFTSRGIFVSESDDSYLVYSRKTGTMHYLKDKSGLDEIVKEFDGISEVKSVYAKSEDMKFKMNLSTVCNLNCDYCFRDKKANIPTDVNQAKRIIDYVVENFSDKVIDFSFSVNLTSEALLEFSKIKEIKSYLEMKTNPLFCCEDFNSIDDALRYLNCFPYELTGPADRFKGIKEIVDAMNEALERKDMVSFFPLPEGVVLPQWEAAQYRNAEKLSGRNLYLFNRRFMEVLFPETFKRKPSYSFFICTNGTFFSDEIVKFFREINIETICVSFDGPPRVHDKHRFFYDFSASHALVLENIKKFMNAGLKVSVASVLTADFPYPLQISEYFKSIDVAGISMVCVRRGKPGSFDKQSIEQLINGYSMLYDRFFEDVKKGDYSLINLLRDDYCFTGIKLLLSKGRLVRRCSWNEDTIFDSKGDVYPCDYFVGKKEYLRGSVNSGEIRDVSADRLEVDDREKCKDCWCKYLCGGTCYYNSFVANGDIGVPDSVECTLNEGVRILCLKFIQRLLDNGIDLYKFGSRIGFYYDRRLSFERTYYVRRGIRFWIKGTLSKVEIELKKMEKVIYDSGCRCRDEIFIMIKSLSSAGVNKILELEVIIPYDAGKDFKGLEGCELLRDFDFEECVSVSCASDERTVVQMKGLLGNAARNFGMTLDGGFWFKARWKVFLGYESGKVNVFIRKKKNIY